MTATERKTDFKLITDTLYLALTGELWDVYHYIFKDIDHVITPSHCIYLVELW